jgi:hypothetical protein
MNFRATHRDSSFKLGVGQSQHMAFSFWVIFILHPMGLTSGYQPPQATGRRWRWH